MLNACEYYNEIIDKFTISSNMLQKRLGHSAVAFRMNTFVIGGCGTLCSLRSAEVLNNTNEQ